MNLLDQDREDILETIVVFFRHTFGEMPNVALVHDDNTLKVEVGTDTLGAVFSFFMEEMPGCCAHVICHHTRINVEMHREEVINFTQRLKVYLARVMLYCNMYATTVSYQWEEVETLKRHGWVEIDGVTNWKTLRHVTTWKKEVKA